MTPADDIAHVPAAAVAPDYFDSLYQTTEDPWGFRSRWYEQRKRDLILACLPKRIYEHTFEPACANGELAAALASRSTRLLASDYHAPAVAAARKRLQPLDNITVQQLCIPEQWPEGSFDLIVIGEVGYYLGISALQECVRRARTAMGANGTLLACHWRHPIGGCSTSGDDVHAVIESAMGQRPGVQHLEADFRLDLWTVDGQSIAQQEGLR